MRIISIISKELKCVKEDISFNLATLISPLLFLLAFSLMLSSGILIPVQTYPGSDSSDFLKSMENYHAPDGTAYFELHTATNTAFLMGYGVDSKCSNLHHFRYSRIESGQIPASVA